MKGRCLLQATQTANRMFLKVSKSMTEDLRNPQQVPLKIYTCHTPSHGGIFQDYFAATLPDTLALHSTMIAARDSSDFGTAGFIQAITDKVDLIIASVKENSGSIIIWSDVDIVFLSDPADEIRKIVAMNPETDLWFQRETREPEKDVNAGFVVMRCTDKVISFYRSVLDLMNVNPNWNDQEAINYLLRGKCGVKWSYLPAAFYARSHGWPPKSRLIMYHANCTFGNDAVGQKIRQFAQLRLLTKYGPLYKAILKIQKAASKVINNSKKVIKHFP